MSPQRPLGNGYPARLGYAANAFPGETVVELTDSIAGPLRRIAERTGDSMTPDGLLGLEMRVSATVAKTLENDPAGLLRLKSRLQEGRLEVLSFNAFSPRDFHARTVKEDAYRPTWLEEERARYTQQVAAIFSELLPEGASASLSTSPGSLKILGNGDGLLCQLAEAYAAAVHFLADLEAKRGRHITLSIEPEPGCTIETTEEFLGFFKEHLLSAGRSHLAALRGCSPSEAERLLYRHIAITFDTAHLGVEFEELIDSARRIAGAGITIGKVHATSAVRLCKPAENPQGVKQLADFLHSPYMHQCIGVDAHSRIMLRTNDLAALLRTPERLETCEELRVHFHLPLFLNHLGALETTASDALAAVHHILAERLCSTIILETYTWKVLELFPGLAAEGIEASISEELRWAWEELFSGVAASS